MRLARGYYPYPTMSLSLIIEYCKEKIVPILHEDCVVGLWITNYHLAQGHHVAVLEALGVNGITIRSWVKDRMGRGQVLRGQTEHAIIATRGKPTFLVDNIATFFHAAIDKKQHSLKPQKFYQDFERLVPAPRYATLFETVDRGAKWDGHGDQVVKASRSLVTLIEPISDKLRIAGDELAVLEAIARGETFGTIGLLERLTKAKLITGKTIKQITKAGRARMWALREERAPLVKEAAE